MASFSQIKSNWFTFKTLILFAGILLSGCATAYQSTGLTGGYEDVDLGGGRYG